MAIVIIGTVTEPVTGGWRSYCAEKDCNWESGTHRGLTIATIMAEDHRREHAARIPLASCEWKGCEETSRPGLQGRALGLCAAHASELSARLEAVGT